MDGLTLIARARAAGLEVRPDGDRLVIRGPRSAEALALQIRDRKPEIMALLSSGDAEVSWRVVAFRERIPAHGPIWPPRIRNTALCDTPGHCSLCGDELPTDAATQAPKPRYPRCQPCIRALWLALHESREQEQEVSA